MSHIKIKTREALQNIKPVNKAEGLAKKSKSGASSLANTAEETQNSRHETEIEYAGNEVEDKEERGGRSLVRGAARFGEWGFRTTVRNIRRWRNRRRKIDFKVDTPKELPSPQRPMLTDGAKQGVKKGAKKASKGIKKTTKKTAKASAKAAKKTAKATAKATKQAAKASAKAAKAGVKLSIRVAQALKRAAIAAVKFAKVAIKAIIAVGKAVVVAVKGIIAAIAAGGWVVVVIIIVVVLVAAIAGSVYAIFVPAEQNSISVYDVMYDLDREYIEKQEALIAEHQYDVLTFEGSQASWKEVVAIYAVKMNLDSENPEDVVIFDERKAEELRNIYWTMNDIRVEKETETKEVKKRVLNENGEYEEVTETVETVYLTVIHDSKSALDTADEYNFTTQQDEMLAELLDDKNADLWQGLLTPAY